MDVAGDSRSSTGSDVHPEVKSGRAIHGAKKPLRPAGFEHQLDGCFFIRLSQRGDMRIWRNHKVPARVGVEVEQSKCANSSMNYEVFFVLCFLGFRAKDARWGGPGGTDVLVPPRTPEMIHA